LLKTLSLENSELTIFGRIYGRQIFRLKTKSDTPVNGTSLPEAYEERIENSETDRTLLSGHTGGKL
jgi:hypothetical protein